MPPSPCVTPGPAQSGQQQQSDSAVLHAVVPLVQVYTAQSQSLQYAPLGVVCQEFRAQGRFWDLEHLLATSKGNYTPEDR